MHNKKNTNNNNMTIVQAKDCNYPKYKHFQLGKI